jgi:hypothetical protein
LFLDTNGSQSGVFLTAMLGLLPLPFFPLPLLLGSQRSIVLNDNDRSSVRFPVASGWVWRGKFDQKNAWVSLFPLAYRAGFDVFSASSVSRRVSLYSYNTSLFFSLPNGHPKIAPDPQDICKQEESFPYLHASDTVLITDRERLARLCSFQIPPGSVRFNGGLERSDGQQLGGRGSSMLHGCRSARLARVGRRGRGRGGGGGGLNLRYVPSRFWG